MAIVFDSFVRLFRIKYTNVTYVSNITDIDDKIIKLPMSWMFLSMNLLKNILKFTMRTCLNSMFFLQMFNLKLTEYVKEMVDFIQQLIEGGKAYEKDGHVFFSCS